MATLVLNVDQRVVAGAEVYARHTRKTVSQLVEEFLASISNTGDAVAPHALCKSALKEPFAEDAAYGEIDNTPLEPITQRLTGIIKLDDGVDYKELLTEALMEKYL